MRVFLTGGTGYLGSAIAAQLVARGHAVTGLARSDRSAAVLAAAGVTPLLGDLADADVLREAVRDADGVIHAGFSHDDWGRMDEAFAQDERAVEAMLDALAGSDKSFVYTSGSGVLADTGPQEAGEDLAQGSYRAALAGEAA
jgi:nucleoside-diphosphate-sugar epimerase